MGRIFYLDAVKGNDENSGITPDKALKSLEAANQDVYKRQMQRLRSLSMQQGLCRSGRYESDNR